MVALRVRYEKCGGHIHCRVFSAPARNQTFAKNGELVFSEEEWNDVLISFKCGGFEVLKEGEQP